MIDFFFKVLLHFFLDFYFLLFYIQFLDLIE